MLTAKTTPVTIYVDTDVVDGEDKYDSQGDFIMAGDDYGDDYGDDGDDEDEDRYEDRYETNVYNDDISSSDKLLVNMTVKSDQVKVLHEIHDHFKDNLLVELELSVDLSDEKTITWTLEYEHQLEPDVKQELIDFVDENVLTHNLVFYYNGERLDETTVLAL